MNATLEELREVIRKSEITTRDPAEFDPAVPLVKQGIDSLDMATLIFHLEDGFGVTISHTSYKDLKSLDDILAYLKTK
ncbi:MAG: Phosphopantetheine attachment site [Chthoniobacter sp.]|jgi:acyl carrier protein|nr:Phosphopantetheine attachment site [Chthoniobacter sp.]